MDFGKIMHDPNVDRAIHGRHTCGTVPLFVLKANGDFVPHIWGKDFFRGLCPKGQNAFSTLVTNLTTGDLPNGASKKKVTLPCGGEGHTFTIELPALEALTFP